MNRRRFLAAIAAGAVVTAEGLWVPGAKLISIPKPRREFFGLGIPAMMRDQQSDLCDAMCYMLASIERDARKELVLLDGNPMNRGGWVRRVWFGEDKINAEWVSLQRVVTRWQTRL